MPWESIAITAAAFAAIGNIIDRLLRTGDKTRLHNALVSYWNQLDESHLPKLPSMMASRILAAFYWAMGTTWKNPRPWIISLTISTALTISSIAFGLTIDIPDVFNSFYRGLGFASAPYVWYKTIPMNFAFDLLTVLATVRALKIVEQQSGWKSIGTLFVLFSIAFVLGMSCQITANLFPSSSVDLSKATFWDHIERPIYSLKMLYFRADKISIGGHPVDYADACYSSTTLLPVTVCISCLTILLISKTLVAIAKFLLDRMTQEDPSRDPVSFIPFTLLGLLFSAISIIANAIKKLI